MNYYEMSEDVINFLNKNGIKKIILLGHSMGGKTAMNIALNNPKRVLALIIVDIAPVKYNHYKEQHEIIMSMKGLKFKSEMSRAEIQKKLGQKIHDKRILAFLMTNLVRHQSQFKWRLGLDEIDNSILELSKFPNQENIFLGPTKFIRGENSDHILAENNVQIKELFPNSSISSLKDCGHWPNYEKPMNFQKEIKSFLKQCGLL